MATKQKSNTGKRLLAIGALLASLLGGQAFAISLEQGFPQAVRQSVIVNEKLQEAKQDTLFLANKLETASGGFDKYLEKTDWQLFLETQASIRFSLNLNAKSPQVRYFLQTDPKGYVDSANLYQSFGNNPVNFTDPMGTIVRSGVNPQVAESAYQQFIKGGYSHASAYRKLQQYGYVTDSGSKADQLYEFYLGMCPIIGITNTTPAQFGKDVVAGTINAGVGLLGMAAQAGAGGNPITSMTITNTQRTITNNINSAIGANEGSLGYWIGGTYAPAIAGGIAAGYMEAAAGTAQTEDMFVKGISLRQDITQTFLNGEAERIVLDEPMKVYRVYGGNSGKVGRFVSLEKFTSQNVARNRLALKYEWSSASKMTEVILPKGTVVWEGQVAPQILKNGRVLNGGANQMWIESDLNPSWFSDGWRFR